MVADKQIYVRTPLIESSSLKQLCGGRRTLLKLENCQPSGSFKLRGISNLCKYAQSQGYTTLVAASGGNAGLATAYSAMKLGMACHIVVPNGTPAAVTEKITSYGATVEFHGHELEQVSNRAKLLTEASKTSFLIHPFNHEYIWQGYASIIDEIAEELGSEAPSLIVTCCGGGGLVVGMCDRMRKHSWENKTKLLVMETEGTHSFNAAVKSGGQRRKIEINSIVACLAASEVCDQIRKDFRYNKPPMLSRVVTDKDAVEACIQFANDHRFLVGLACGTALCGMYNGFADRILSELEPEVDTKYDRPVSKEFAHNKDGPVVIIICGGSEIDLNLIVQYRNQFQIDC